MRTLDYNLLAKQLDAILATPLPRPEDTVRGTSAIPVLDDVVSGPGFTPEEAERIGLVEESAIDWTGKVDIDLSAQDEGDSEVTELDINIDGLPPPEPVEPTHGASLADHVQIGFAYRCTSKTSGTRCGCRTSARGAPSSSSPAAASTSRRSR